MKRVTLRRVVRPDAPMAAMFYRRPPEPRGTIRLVVLLVIAAAVIVALRVLR